LVGTHIEKWLTKNSKDTLFHISNRMPPPKREINLLRIPKPCSQREGDRQREGTEREREKPTMVQEFWGQCQALQEAR
jgi:hypothetical protein